jgi:hypothetical protein
VTSDKKQSPKSGVRGPKSSSTVVSDEWREESPKMERRAGPTTNSPRDTTPYRLSAGSGEKMNQNDKSEVRGPKSEVGRASCQVLGVKC